MYSLRPQVTSLVKTPTVRCHRYFQINMKPHFSPDDLRFQLIGQNPSWVVIDNATGKVSGIPPLMEHSRQFLITVEAYNNYGAAKLNFFIKVDVGDVVESVAMTLKNILSLKKKIYRYPDHIATIRELLEYIFEYYQASEFKQEFLSLVWENAHKLNLKLNQPIRYEDFKKVAERINPKIEQQLREKLDPHHLLLTAELSNAEFRRLFRQGSQPLGAHPIPVWNYIMSPRLEMWRESQLGSVLEAAAEDLIHLHVQNDEYQLTHQLTPQPYPPIKSH